MGEPGVGGGESGAVRFPAMYVTWNASGARASRSVSDRKATMLALARSRQPPSPSAASPRSWAFVFGNQSPSAAQPPPTPPSPSPPSPAAPLPVLAVSAAVSESSLTILDLGLTMMAVSSASRLTRSASRIEVSSAQHTGPHTCPGHSTVTAPSQHSHRTVSAQYQASQHSHRHILRHSTGTVHRAAHPESAAVVSALHRDQALEHEPPGLEPPQKKKQGKEKGSHVHVSIADP